MSRWGWRLMLILLTGWRGPASAAASARFLITELYYDTPGTDLAEEWIEIANIGSEAGSLAGYKIGDAAYRGAQEGMRRFPESASLEPGTAIVVAQSAVGFSRLFGFLPDFELTDSDPAVPDMGLYQAWSQGDLALANDGDELLLLDPLDRIIDAVNYGDRDTFLIPAVQRVFSGQSIERSPANCDFDSAVDWRPSPIPTPGVIYLENSCQLPGLPAEQVNTLTIGEIQGPGEKSPYVNKNVTFQGVVTGFLEDRNAQGDIYQTVFLQDLPGNEDGDPLTSDGIGLFMGRRLPIFEIGDVLRVSGQISEFYGFTEVDVQGLKISIESRGAELPAPVPRSAMGKPQSLANSLEPLEGMLLALPDPSTVIGPTHAGCGFELGYPGSGAGHQFRRAEQDVPSGIIALLHRSDVICDGFPEVKTGDQIFGAAGPLVYHFNQYKVVQQQTALLRIDAAPLKMPPTLQTAPGQFSAATFNLDNYFDQLDDTGSDDEPKLTQDVLQGRQVKLAYVISHVLGCPAVIGVQEVEKERLLTELAQLVSTPCGFQYQVSHRESPDIRGIDVAMLTDPRLVAVKRVETRQGCARLNLELPAVDAGCPAGQSALFSRPPLVVDLEIGGESYAVIVTHFKSKRGGEIETAPRRRAQAAFVHELTAARLAVDPGSRIILMGDFNDYERSAPMRLLTTGEGALTNVLMRVPDEARYSYIFDGAAQLVDGILVSPALLTSVADVQIAHVNADYPAGYQLAAEGPLLPFRSSDHDVPLLWLWISPRQPLAEPLPEATAVPRPPQDHSTVQGVSDEALPLALMLAALLALTAIRLYKRNG